MSKHTKEEWKISDQSDKYRIYIGTDNRGVACIEMSTWTTNKEEQKKLDVHPENIEDKANARLIIKAPLLLENLTRILDRIEESNLQDNFPSAYKRAKELLKTLD